MASSGLAAGLTVLKEHGAQFVLLHPPTPEDPVHPLLGGYQHEHPSVNQAAAHVKRGGRIGLVNPGPNMGLDVLDVDEWDPKGLARLLSEYPPLLANEARRGPHLYYQNDGKNHWRQANGVRLLRHRVKLDLRSGGSAIVVLHGEEYVANLAEALEGPARSAPFPRNLFLNTTAINKQIKPVDAAWLAERRRIRDRGYKVRQRPPRAALAAEYQDNVELRRSDVMWAASLKEPGRYNDLFEIVRRWAYLQHRGPASSYTLEGWIEKVTGYVAGVNACMPVPLDQGRVLITGRSIGEWTWENPDFGYGWRADRHDPEVQRERVLRRGPSVRRKHWDSGRDARIWSLHQRGESLRKIGADPLVQLSHVQVSRLLKKWGEDGPAEPERPASTSCRGIVWKRRREAAAARSGARAGTSRRRRQKDGQNRLEHRYINHQAPRGSVGVFEADLGGDDEIRNASASQNDNGKRSKSRGIQPEPGIKTRHSDRKEASGLIRESSLVDNSRGKVDKAAEIELKRGYAMGLAAAAGPPGGNTVQADRRRPGPWWDRYREGYERGRREREKEP